MREPIATIKMPWFETEDGIYEIDDFDMCEVFVVVGEERALVIDTGMGYGDMRWLIENKITDKPYDVVATHAHGDHLGGAEQFEKIYIHEKDYPAACDFKDVPAERTKGYATMIKIREHKHYSYDMDKDLIPVTGKTEYIPIKDGHVFDLGGRTVTCYHCPGHTIGEIVLVDSKTKALLAGDACNENFGLNNITGTTYQESAKMAYEAANRILSMAGEKYDLDKVYNFHHDYRGFGNPLNPDTLPNLVAGLKSIVEHNAHYEEVRDPFSNEGGKRIVVKVGDVEIATRGIDIRTI